MIEIGKTNILIIQDVNVRKSAKMS